MPCIITRDEAEPSMRRCSCLLVKYQLLLGSIVLLPDKRSEGRRLQRCLVVWQRRRALAAGVRCCAQVQCCKAHGVQQVVGACRCLQYHARRVSQACPACTSTGTLQTGLGPQGVAPLQLWWPGTGMQQQASERPQVNNAQHTPLSATCAKQTKARRLKSRLTCSGTLSLGGAV